MDCYGQDASMATFFSHNPIGDQVYAAQPLSQDFGVNLNNSLNCQRINYDPEPHIVRKQANGQIIYKQEVAVRYLKPPTPPPLEPVVIKEIRATQAPPAPPFIIRQRPPRPATPPPLVIREKPPKRPECGGPKVITRSLPAPPPPPRRVIIERLPPLPPKPRSIIIEKWVPYKEQKRRVIYQRAPQIQPLPPMKNLIIQWEGAKVKVLKEFKSLGVTRTDPIAYTQKYGTNLKQTSELPDFVKEVKIPEFDDSIKPDEGTLEENEEMDNAMEYSSDYMEFFEPDTALDASSTEVLSSNMF
ncbi:hypothetical protein ACOME3_004135 [Neoechinorhynchus agilis]